MILPGQALVSRNIITGLVSSALQSQPCGVDLTLKRILTWQTHGSIDFDNTRRQTAATKEIFPNESKAENQPLEEMNSIRLPLGSYLVEFNETVRVPLDLMGQIFVRSSLFRSGALLNAGLMDSGYEGAVGALLQVLNPLGLELYKNAKLAQIVFHQMTEPVEGYNGTYQGSASLSGVVAVVAEEVSL